MTGKSKPPRLRMLSPLLPTLDTRMVKPAPKAADAHYSTAEHKAWRAEVLRRAGHRCQGCGRTDGRLFADHVTEISDGGAPLDVSNGQALCGSCHTSKTLAARAARHGLR